MAEEKLLGKLRFDTSTLAKDIAEANKLLASVGKGVNLDLGTAFKKQLDGVLAEVKKLATEVNAAAKQAASVKTSSGSSSGSGSSASKIAEEKKQVQALSTAYANLYNLRSKQVKAEVGSKVYEELRKQIVAAQGALDVLLSKSTSTASAQARETTKVTQAYDRLKMSIASVEDAKKKKSLSQTSKDELQQLNTLKKAYVSLYDTMAKQIKVAPDSQEFEHLASVIDRLENEIDTYSSELKSAAQASDAVVKAQEKLGMTSAASDQKKYNDTLREYHAVSLQIAKLENQKPKSLSERVALDDQINHLKQTQAM